MPERVAGLQPEILRWARQRSGFSVAEAAARVGKEPGAIESWESGKEAPTFRQLEALVEGVYKRPIALFFFPAPPDEPDAGSEFRTLPAAEIEALEPDTRLAVREALAYRESLTELTDGRNPAARLITTDIRPGRGEPVVELAARVRQYLDVDLGHQMSWRDNDDALKQWRSAVDSVGVFVFKRPFKQRGISGFCLHDELFPLVVLNNSTAHSRQVFTLFHELGHLLFAVSGVTKDSLTFLRHLRGANRDIEVACNEFAAEFLVPSASFPWREFQGRDLYRAVEAVASRFHVSREVILRRLLDREMVDQATYEEWAERWTREYAEHRAAMSGGNYYANKATYLGQSFLQLAFSRYYAGRLTVGDLADHLRVKARSIPRLENLLVADR
jgi:Zn-dependent peptidase ImmA (M78 family)/transcriptional regulator with XRE-family HTH domain